MVIRGSTGREIAGVAQRGRHDCVRARNQRGYGGRRHRQARALAFGEREIVGQRERLGVHEGRARLDHDDRRFGNGGRHLFDVVDRGGGLASQRPPSRE